MELNGRIIRDIINPSFHSLTLDLVGSRFRVKEATKAASAKLVGVYPVQVILF
jgi:hypothetical protein